MWFGAALGIEPNAGAWDRTQFDRDRRQRLGIEPNLTLPWDRTQSDLSLGIEPNLPPDRSLGIEPNPASGCKKTFNTNDSQLVPHVSTELAQ